MFLHLGMNQMIRIHELVAIISVKDQKASSLPYVVESDQAEEIKSVVVTTNRVYPSPISSLTLMKRAVQNQNFGK